ncbi:MAG: hypothetical protein JWM39_662 [Parcubacteria group bacterium]|nr:hypothetical protein [Parcubacteria group bacterium]
MAADAPTPTLNSTAPPVNLMAQWFHYGNSNTPATQNSQAVQTSQAQTGQPAPLPQINISGFVPVVFSGIFLIWVIYTFVVIYHWFRYRHKSWFAVPAIALHLFVSGSIIIYMISGLQ